MLDTSFLIDLERGNAAASRALERLVDAREPLLVPAQAAAEYATGRKDENAALSDIEASYALVSFGPRQVLEVARLARESLRSGTFRGWADAQIAAVAVLEGTFVVTADPEDFAEYGCDAWDYRRKDEPPQATR